MQRSLSDWLRWQESLSSREIDLGLDRVRRVAARLPIEPPPGAVFTVAGTNGKGSTVACLDRLLRSGGYRTGAYTSPHLVRYNERVHLAGDPVDDAALTGAFEQIETVRGDMPLTFFEFGTLAALLLFSGARCDAWILEVGLGGRLDAVNVIDPDFSLITTVGLDHQDWLGESIDEIAVEKAGIMRAAAPAFYGDDAPPPALVARAVDLGTQLHCFGRNHGIGMSGERWSWRGETVRLGDLHRPAGADDTVLRNASLAMAAVEQFDMSLLTRENVDSLVAAVRPAGRFQVVAREPQWILDVAHNPQAAAILRDRIEALGEPRDTTVVVGMLAGKQIDEFAAALVGIADRWIVASLAGPRAMAAAGVADRVARLSARPVEAAATPVAAFARALEITPGDGRVLCCGSFRIVGPAIEWLGLYS